MDDFWTPENIGHIRKLWDEGWTTNAIAVKVGCTKSMVSGYTQKNRSMFPPRIARLSVALLKADIKDLAHAWSNDSLTSDEIGALFGLKGVEVREVAALNRDLFPPRNPATKKRHENRSKNKPPRQNPRISSVWTRRDPSQPPPSYYDPLHMDDYELTRLPHAKLLHNLAAGECKWPLGEDRPYRFCACQTTQAGTYCAHHVVKAVGVGTKSEREAVKIGRAA